MKPVRIVIFAKAPLPGFAKTRLIPALGANGAANLAARLLAHTVQEAIAAAVGPVELCLTPSIADSRAWENITLVQGICCSEQGEGDLGQRLARAARRVLANGEVVLLIGTDCPQLDASLLRQAAKSLTQYDSVLLPTYDGGYALLGLTRFHASLFTQVAWSTASVSATTQARILDLGWTVDELPRLNDIDEPADLQWLPAHWAEATASYAKSVTTESPPHDLIDGTSAHE